MSVTLEEYEKAQKVAKIFENSAQFYTQQLVKAEERLNEARRLKFPDRDFVRDVQRLTETIAEAEKKIQSAQQIVSDFEKQSTIPSESETETQKKYENSEVLAASTNDQVSDSSLGELGINTSIPSDSSLGELGINTDQLSPLNRSMKVPSGAMPATPKPASVNFKTLTGESVNQDMRVKIRVPENYYSGITISKKLQELKAIIFPYTPSIGIEHKADYSTQQPMHSNFAQYFYQKSSVSPISISGKFTVANEEEAAIYISTVHLLRALTKMRSGGSTGDFDSGAPPPVCRLDAYGTFMLQNVPVSISSFKIDLPDNIDYFTLGKKDAANPNQSSSDSIYEMTSVPVFSTISITCIPMYSRDEMQKFNVTQWLNEKYVRKAGFL